DADPSIASAFRDELRVDRAASLRRERAEAAGHPVAVPSFVDDAEAVGLRFTYDNGASILRQLPEQSGGGLGLLCADGAGWLAVYGRRGAPSPPRGDRPPSGDRLFRNRGNGTFEDATESSGLARLPRGYGHGVAVGDYDGDGDPDLFVTRWGSYALY